MTATSTGMMEYTVEIYVHLSGLAMVTVTTNV